MNYHRVIQRLIDMYEAGYNNASLVSELKYHVEDHYGHGSRNPNPRDQPDQSQRP